VCTHQNTICCRPSATEGSRLPEAYFVIYFSKKKLGGVGVKNNYSWFQFLLYFGHILFLHGRECALFHKNFLTLTNL
jgi:hypothetical protein